MGLPTLVAIETIARQRELAAKTDDPRLAFIPSAVRAKWTPEDFAKAFTRKSKNGMANRLPTI